VGARSQGIFSCDVGQHVSAIWSGNGQSFNATIASINKVVQTVLVDWDDGDTSRREVQFSEITYDSGTVCLTGELKK
jgi:hypothetical protein